MGNRRISVRGSLDELYGGAPVDRLPSGGVAPAASPGVATAPQRQSDLATERPGDMETPVGECAAEVQGTSPSQTVDADMSPSLHGDSATQRHRDTVPQTHEVVPAAPVVVATARPRQSDVATSRQSGVAASRHVATATSEPAAGTRAIMERGGMSPCRQVAAPEEEEPAVRLIKKDFYLTTDQDLQIDRVCMETKQRTGRSIARSDVVREALDEYFANRTNR